MVSTKDEFTDYQLTDDQIRKVLHEPVAPYVVNVYNTLMHLVEGLVLAAIFYVITIQPHITPIIISNLIICLVVVISSWHGYITYNQYSVMRASILNTIIPIGFGVAQVALVLTISQPIYIFTLFLIPCFVIIIIQYWENINKHNKPIAFKIWKAHFKDIGSQFAKDFFDELRRYEKESVSKIYYLTLFLVILTLFNYFFPLNLEIKSYISFIILLSIFIIGMSFADLNRFLKKSEKLRKYGSEEW